MLKLRNITKFYQTSTGQNIVLKRANFEVSSGEMSAIVAPSGSGKSTLLNIIGLLDHPMSGKVIFGGKDLSNLSDAAKTEFRRKNLGFIFQSHYLLNNLTVEENLQMPLLLNGISMERQQLEELMEKFGLPGLLHRLPSQLSGGQQQRVAVLRAIVHKPRLVLADEPTGNLDADNALRVFQEFSHMAKSEGVAVVVVTHNLELARQSDKIYTLKDHKVLPYEAN